MKKGHRFQISIQKEKLSVAFSSAVFLLASLGWFNLLFVGLIISDTELGYSATVVVFVMLILLVCAIILPHRSNILSKISRYVFMVLASGFAILVLAISVYAIRDGEVSISEILGDLGYYRIGGVKETYVSLFMVAAVDYLFMRMYPALSRWGHALRSLVFFAIALSFLVETPPWYRNVLYYLVAMGSSALVRALWPKIMKRG